MAADADAIASLHVRAWRAAYRGHVPDAYLDGQSVSERALVWQAVITRRSQRTWVIEHDGRVAGFVTAGPSRDPGAPARTAELGALYVEPALIGRGLGGRLATHAVGELRAHGFERATLWVLRANKRARRFYERGGWRPDGAEKLESIGGRELPELRYARTLDP